MSAVAFWRRLMQLESSAAVGALMLVGFNLVPLLGVLFLGWNVYSILILYWVENGIVGAVNVLKMARAEGIERTRGDSDRVTGAQRGGLIAFFVMHYGIFWVVHGVFVFVGTLFAIGLTQGSGPARGFSIDWLPVAILGLVVVHLATYYFTFIRGGEYLRVSPDRQMWEPYPRVVVLHVVILLGGFVTAWLGQPVALVALLVVVKTVIDLALYAYAHGRRVDPVIAR